MSKPILIATIITLVLLFPVILIEGNTNVIWLFLALFGLVAVKAWMAWRAFIKTHEFIPHKYDIKHSENEYIERYLKR